MTRTDLEAARQMMLHQHLAGRGIDNRRVLAAMASVPRERFVDAEQRKEAYADKAMTISCGQTISQPFIVGLMTQALELAGGERVLEIGTGSGYQTAVLATLSKEVVSIERHEDLSRHAGAVLDELGFRNIELVVGDGTLGWPAGAPYDRIIVTAAAVKIPVPLLDQLVEGGILVIPIGPVDQQQLQALRKVRGDFIGENLSACRFVPLVGAQRESDDTAMPSQ